MQKLVVGVLSAALLLAAPAAAAVWPYVHSHRGGAVRDGKAAFAEESMPAFRSAWKRLHTVLELDVKLTKDGVPVVIHDDSLDRTTPCTGGVAERTWASLRRLCPSDVLGIAPLKTAPARRLVPMAKLRYFLRYAKDAGAFVNLEIKNIPTDADYDSSEAFATAVCDAIRAARFPLKRLIVQSFWPPDLDVAARELPGAQTSFLTLTGDPVWISYAAGRGYDWWSPSWPVDANAVASAHQLGLKVVPWTVDDAAGIRAAKAAGADAVITNDPVMAKKALRTGSGK
jgi:glycerophosphoryl diester phosphodiesterase